MPAAAGNSRAGICAAWVLTGLRAAPCPPGLGGRGHKEEGSKLLSPSMEGARQGSGGGRGQLPGSPPLPADSWRDHPDLLARAWGPTLSYSVFCRPTSPGRSQFALRGDPGRKAGSKEGVRPCLQHREGPQLGTRPRQGGAQGRGHRSGRNSPSSSWRMLRGCPSRPQAAGLQGASPHPRVSWVSGAIHQAACRFPGACVLQPRSLLRTRGPRLPSLATDCARVSGVHRAQGRAGRCQPGRPTPMAAEARGGPQEGAQTGTAERPQPQSPSEVSLTARGLLTRQEAAAT